MTVNAPSVSSPKSLTVGSRPPALGIVRPSPGLRTIGSTAAVYELRRAPQPLLVLLPRRCLAAGGAGRAGGGARLRGARAHRPRRAVRIARVRARGEGLRGPPDHRRRALADRRLARDVARGDAAGLLQPLPVDHD